MAFGNEDAIDKRNRDRIRELETALRMLINAFARCTSMTQNEKQAALEVARSVLRHET